MVDRDESPYVRPRIWVGVGLFVLVFILAIVDVMRPDVTIDTIQFGLLLGTSLAMLGLDAGKRLLS